MLCFQQLPPHHPELIECHLPAAALRATPACPAAAAKGILFYLQGQTLVSVRAGGVCEPVLSHHSAQSRPRAVREFLSLEMKNCTLLHLLSLIFTGQAEVESWWDHSLPLFSIINLNDCLLHALLHFKCPILPIYCHALRASAFPGSVHLSTQKELKNFSHQAKLAEGVAFFLFFSLFCLQGRHS